MDIILLRVKGFVKSLLSPSRSLNPLIETLILNIAEINVSNSPPHCIMFPWVRESAYDFTNWKITTVSTCPLLMVDLSSVSRMASFNFYKKSVISLSGPSF